MVNVNARVASMWLLSLLWFLGLLVGQTWAHGGHDLEEDLVCGMKIKPESAAGKLDYQGQTFYFCSIPDLQTFRANPDRYAGFLALSRTVGGRTYTLAVKPRRPRAGEEIVLTLTLPDKRWLPGPPSRGTTPPLEVLFFDLDAAHTEVGRGYLHMPPAATPGVYSLGRLLTQPGTVRLLAFVPPLESTEPSPSLEGGVPRRPPDRAAPSASIPTAIPFGFPVDPAVLPSGPPPAPSSPNRPTPQALTMEAQHESMRVIGHAWDELHEALSRTPAAWTDVLRQWQRIEAMVDRLPGFELHRFPEDKAQFIAMGREFALAIRQFRTRIDRQDRAATVAEYVRIDGQVCTRCHLKFRWGSVADLTRFPDLRIHPTP